MSPQNNDEINRVRARLERFQLSNTDLRQQLSDALARSQRLASSLGFRDIYEAQATIDTADQNLSYRQCLEELETLRVRDSALGRVRELEEQSRTSKLIADDIAVDVLPFALRLAHCEVSGLRQSDVDDLPVEGAIKMYEFIGQGRETLQRNAKLVRKWEDMFSFRQKDRKSKASRLTPAESFRFQRALYRIMLVCWLYGMDSIPASDMQDKHYPYAFCEIYQARQTKFLAGFPTDELFEIDRVVRFLVYMASSIMVRHNVLNGLYDWSGLYLFAGPTFIMNQYRDREEDAKDDIPFQNLCSYLYDDGPYSNFLNHHLRKNTSTRSNDPHFQQRILDSVEGAEDICIRCQGRDMYGMIFFLRNESSWDFMKFSDILLDLNDEVSCIWSTMELQYPETKLFFNEVKKISSKQLMEEIFELRQAEYTSWNREDWACMGCWRSLLKDTFPIWWAKRRPQQMDGKDEA